MALDQKRKTNAGRMAAKAKSRKSLGGPLSKKASSANVSSKAEPKKKTELKPGHCLVQGEAQVKAGDPVWFADKANADVFSKATVTSVSETGVVCKVTLSIRTVQKPADSCTSFCSRLPEPDECGCPD